MVSLQMCSIKMNTPRSRFWIGLHLLIFFRKIWGGERGETISLKYIALSRISFKCIKIAVTESYITNCVLNCTDICLNQLHAFDNWKSFILSLITAGAKCASRDEVCQAHFSRIIQVIYTIALLR